MDVESKEHYGAVTQVRNEVTVATGCDGSVQEAGSTFSGGSLDTVVVTQLERKKQGDSCEKVMCRQFFLLTTKIKICHKHVCCPTIYHRGRFDAEVIGGSLN